MTRCYKERAVPKGRCRCGVQGGQGVGSLFSFKKKLAKNLIVRNLGKMALKELPGVYTKGVRK